MRTTEEIYKDIMDLIKVIQSCYERDVVFKKYKTEARYKARKLHPLVKEFINSSIIEAPNVNGRPAKEKFKKYMEEQHIRRQKKGTMVYFIEFLYGSWLHRNGKQLTH